MKKTENFARLNYEKLRRQQQVEITYIIAELLSNSEFMNNEVMSYAPNNTHDCNGKEGNDTSIELGGVFNDLSTHDGRHDLMRYVHQNFIQNNDYNDNSFEVVTTCKVLLAFYFE